MRNLSRYVRGPRPVRARGVGFTAPVSGMEAPAYETEFETGRHFAPPTPALRTPLHVFVPLDPNGQREEFHLQD